MYPRVDYEQLFENYMREAPSALMKKAYSYCREKHDNCPTPKRMEGIPYWTHPFEVRELAIKLSWESKVEMDQDEQIAAVLHDIDEDTDGTIDEIERLFGPQVAFYVKHLSNSQVCEGYNEMDRVERKTLYLKHVGQGGRKTVYLKTIDRYHNLSSLFLMLHTKPKKFRRFAFKQATETLDLVVPLAYQHSLPLSAGLLIGLSQNVLRIVDYIEAQREAQNA